MNKNLIIRRNALLIVSSISSLIYIGWRIFFTIPTEYGLVSLVAGIALVVAETVGVIEAFSHYRNMSYLRSPEKPEIPLDWYPDVDVFIATHSEATELIYKTINGCKHMKYPDLSKVHIYLCDDNDRPEMKQLAKDTGVGYFGLANNTQAKAGNLNNALGKTNSPLVVTFDADMIPTQNFLIETVPYFFLPLLKKDAVGNWVRREETEIDQDFKIGFIQTPQSFYNADLFQYNLFAEKNIPNEQDYFFKEVNVGRNRTNSSIYAGSNTVIARAALEEVGGFTTGSITEDFATGIQIQSRGYRCFAIAKVLAHGLAPNDIKSLLKQRQRWGRGCIQVLLSSKFLFSKLPFRAKMSYLACFLYWWTFLRRFVYIVSPILFTVFGIIVVDCSFWELLLIWLPAYLIYNRTLKVLSGNIRDQKWSNIVDTIIFPYMIIPIFAETLGLKMNKFLVTPKNKPVSGKSEARYAIPHMLLAGATLIGLWQCIKNIILYKSFGNIVLIYWLIVNLYFLYMATIFMLGRINFRSEERFYAPVNIEIRTLTDVYAGVTSDISEGGLAVLLDAPEYIPYDEDLEISVQYLDYSANIKGRIVHVARAQDKWKYSIKITGMTGENKGIYFQIVFDRGHTLPTIIKSGIVKDFTETINGRTDRLVISNRRLPRIPLDVAVQTVEGRPVTIVNYNYEYLLLKGLDTNSDEVNLNLADGLMLKCLPVREVSFMDGVLCKIDNWEEVSRDRRLKKTLFG